MYNRCTFSSSPTTNVKRWFTGGFSPHSRDFVSIHPPLFPSLLFSLIPAPTETASHSHLFWLVRRYQSERSMSSCDNLSFDVSLEISFPSFYDYTLIEPQRKFIIEQISFFIQRYYVLIWRTNEFLQKLISISIISEIFTILKKYIKFYR